jgi:site-specific recombinase XerD
MEDYESYEAECKKIKKVNKKLLNDFASWLRGKNLTEKTIRNHRLNVDFYINDFLLYADTVEAKDGASQIGLFLGDWFIRKAIWSSSATIKSNAAGLKKFYSFMLEKHLIDKETLDDLYDKIKEDMPVWINTLRRFDDELMNESDEIWDF